MGKTLSLDFSPLAFCGEARTGHGEDNWCYSFSDTAGMIAVFDGCGGSGARQHSIYSNHSEAYMASRLCAGAMYECIQKYFPCQESMEEFVQQTLLPYISRRLKANQPPAGSLRISGLRTLPSTMAAALIRQCPDGMVEICTVWAGDSRVYLLDGTGLSQLMTDDTNQPDPMEGLYDDGTLTNVICADRPIRLNCRTIRVKPPFMVLTASDGCFGYVSTPMEFEGMILHTLLETGNVAQWQDQLQKLIASYAGDDHTMVLAAFGFGSFAALQAHFAQRNDYLKQEYLDTVWATPWEDRALRRKLWSTYRKNYLKYIEGEQT